MNNRFTELSQVLLSDRFFAPNVYLFAYTLIAKAENKHNPF